MQNSTINPFFISTPSGRCFAIHFEPVDKASKRNEAVLIIPPFAEELNNSRRIISKQARILADDGFDVLFPDLWGTGDSEGEFIDATWDIWLSNLNHAFTWLSNGAIKRHILTVRAGSLLGAALLEEYSINVDKFLLWQPVVNGELFMKQFIRLRIASQAFKGIKETNEGLTNKLQEKGSLEVAGYEVNSSLVRDISSLEFILDEKHISSAHIFEVGISNSTAAKSLAEQALVQTIRSFECDQYWANIEASIGEGFLLATKEALRLP